VTERERGSLEELAKRTGFERAFRYLDSGKLPLPEKTKAYDREKITEREKTEGKKLDYHTVVQEFWAFSNDRLV
jgi:glutamate mutase epsilon subunit